MRRRLSILIDFYRAPAAMLFLAGIALLLMLLIDLGANVFLVGLGGIFIAAGLPLRTHSQTSGLYILLEEERQITHGRLSALEEDASDDEVSQP